jgi:chemotaxis protein CheX
MFEPERTPQGAEIPPPVSVPGAITPSEVQEVVSAVFRTMLQIDATASFDIAPPQGDMVTAAVYLSGKHQGAVLLHCPPWQACSFAAQFLGKTPPSEVNDDVLDVMGELANMVAGNLKGTLISGTYLSIPSVTQGRDSLPRLCGSRPVQRTGFSTPLGPVWVTMFTTASSR